MTNTRRIASAAALLAAAATLVACGGTPRTEQQLSEIRDRPTPELATMSQRPADLENNWAMYLNQMQRMRREDLRRVFMIDRPSRLTPLPVSR